MFVLLLSACLIAQALAIWPVPKSFTAGDNVLWIDVGVQVKYNGQSVGQTSTPLNFSWNLLTEKVLGVQSFMTAAGTGSGILNSEMVITSAISRTLQTMFTTSLIPWKFYPRNNISQFEPAANGEKTQISCLEIIQTAMDRSSTFKPLAGELDESYNITITSDGLATISAASPSGIIYGLETFTQLFYEHSSGRAAGLYTQQVPIEIIDAPKFAHRGLNMDVSRNYFPVSDIMRTIDALS